MKYIYKSFVIYYSFKKRGDDCILFLHGWGGDKNSFAVCEPYVKNFSTLSISLPPNRHLNSLQALTMFDYVKIVVSLLTAHNIQNPIIVCHSFGCRVALLLSSKIAIKKLVICAGAGIKQKNKKLTTLNITKKWLDNRDLKFHNRIGSKDYLALSQIDKITFKNIVNFDLKCLIEKITCPTLLYWGLQDKETPMQMCSYFHKHIKNSRCKIVDFGHFAYLENKHDFCYELKNFLGEK